MLNAIHNPMTQKLSDIISNESCPLAQPLDVLHDWLSTSVQWPADTSLSHLKLRRLWPSRRKEISFELLITLNTKTTPREVTLQGGWRSQPRWKTSRHKAKVFGDALLGVRLRHDSQDLWVCSPDRDKRIRCAAELFDHQELANLLSSIDSPAETPILADYSPDQLQLSLKGYRVQKRCIVQVTQDNHTNHAGVMVKAFHRLPKGYDLESLSQLHQQLQQLSQDTIMLTTTLAIDHTKRLIVTSRVHGDAQPLSYQQDGVALAAKVLACLHACDPKTTNTTHSIADELGTLTRWPDVLTLICKSLEQSTLSTIIERLSDQANRHASDDLVMVHRDFYHAQLLQHEKTTWLLDLDTICTAQREVDLATFLAHLLLDNAQQNFDSQQTSDIAESFVASYIKHGGTINVSRLAFYLSCALARLCCIHAVRGERTHTIQHLWTLASAILDASALVESPTQLIQLAIQKCSSSCVPKNI